MIALRKQGHRLRIAGYTINPVLEIPTSGLEENPELRGVLGKSSQEFLEAAGINYSIIEPKEKHLGYPDPVTGRYNGAVGLLVEGKADLQMMPFNTDLENQPVNFGPTLMSGELRILSAFFPNKRPVSFIETYIAFSPEVWSLFLSSLLLLALSLTLLTSRSVRRVVRDLLDSFWVCFSHILHEGDFSPKSWKLRCLLISLGFCAFYLEEFYCNKICTDMMAFDLSAVINTVEDLARSGRYPIFMEDDNSNLYFKQSSDPTVAQVWSALIKYKQENEDYNSITLRTMMENGAGIIGDFISRRGALVMIEYMLKTTLQVFCPVFVHLIDEGKVYPIISKYSYGGQTLAPYYSKNMTLEMRLALDDFLYRLGESGLVANMYYKLESNPSLEEKPLNCLGHSIDGLYGENSNNQVELENFHHQFSGLFVGLFVGFLCLLWEVVVNMNEEPTLIQELPFVPEGGRRQWRRKVVKWIKRFTRALITQPLTRIIGKHKWEQVSEVNGNRKKKRVTKKTLKTRFTRIDRRLIRRA